MGVNCTKQYPNELRRFGIDELVDFRGSYYKIKRNDPAYFTVSISRNMSRFVTQFLCLSFGVFLTTFSVMYDLWFILVFGGFWSLCSLIMMWSSLTSFYRIWYFKQECIDISPTDRRDTWMAISRTWGIFGPSTQTFSDCEGSFLGQKKVYSSEDDFYIVNYVSFHHHTGTAALWCEADRPSQDKSIVYKKLCESLGIDDTVDPYFDTVPNKSSTKPGPTGSEDPISSLSRRLFIKQIRLDMLNRSRPSKMDDRAYTSWKVNVDTLTDSLVEMQEMIAEYPPEFKREPSQPSTRKSTFASLRLENRKTVPFNSPRETTDLQMNSTVKPRPPQMFPPMPPESDSENEIVFE